MYKILKDNLSIPVAYGQFNNPVVPPFVVYLYSSPEVMAADNMNYYVNDTFTIEYYFNKKDREKEREIENLLNSNELIWSKTEDIWIDEEKIYVVYYEV